MSTLIIQILKHMNVCVCIYDYTCIQLAYSFIDVLIYLLVYFSVFICLSLLTQAHTHTHTGIQAHRYARRVAARLCTCTDLFLVCRNLTDLATCVLVSQLISQRVPHTLPLWN